MREAARRQKAGGWIDAVRALRAGADKLYTWWSYRAADWTTSDNGRRLDHIWTSHMLADRVSAITVAKDYRGAEAAVRPCTGDGDAGSVS